MHWKHLLWVELEVKRPGQGWVGYWQLTFSIHRQCLGKLDAPDYPILHSNVQTVAVARAVAVS